MTSQEVRALIDAKIKGQGTNVDAGSVLPAILNGILDLIDSGGGGGTSDAVQYIPQELTGAQQMQARKNQGLYYSEGGGEDVTLTWDGDTTGKDYFEDGHLYKISTDTPQAEQLKSFVLQDAHSSESMTINISEDDIISGDGYYGVVVTNPELGVVIFVCLAPEATLGGYTFTQGIWLWKTSGYISQLVYGQTETIHHIEPKYIKDMYYEETNEGEIDINIPNPDEWPYSDSIYLSGMDYLRVSGETPQQSDITAIFRIEGQDTTVAGADLEIKTTGYGSKLIAYQAPDSNLAETKFIIVPEDTTIEGASTPKGIYFPQISSYANNHIESISFPGTITTVHQIPSKYIPSTGLDVFEIKVSQDISYGEPIEVENVTYQDIMDACNAGKYIVLTILGYDNDVRGRCLGGNFSRMEDTGDSIYGQPCYCFAGAYRKASSGSSGQFGSYSLKDVVLYEDANDGLLYVELQDCNG